MLFNLLLFSVKRCQSLLQYWQVARYLPVQGNHMYNRLHFGPD